MLVNLIILCNLILCSGLFIAKIVFGFKIDSTTQYIQFVVDTINILLAYILWRRLKQARHRLFTYLPYIFVMIFLVDTVYFVLYYIISPQPNTWLYLFADILNNAILISWFFLSMFFMLRTIHRYIIYKPVEWLWIILVFVIIDTFILRFFAFSHPNFNTAISNLAFFWVTHYIAELIDFNLAIILLIHSKNRYLTWLSSSLAIGMACQFVFTSIYVYGALDALEYAELLWLVAILIAMTSQIMMIRANDYNVINWFHKTNSLNGRMVFSVFVIALMSFILPFIILQLGSSINKLVFVFFPTIAMTYSLVAAFIAIKLSINLEYPFRKLKMNIEQMYKGQENNQQLIKNKLAIQEFRDLQSFIKKLFNYKIQNEQLQLEMVRIATGVAHDIKSPLMVIDPRLNQIVASDDPNHKVIKNALRSVKNIAENMLTIYNNYNRSTQLINLKNIAKSYILATDLLEEIYCQKEAEWENDDRSANLQLNLNTDKLLWLNISGFEFKRHISNLLNNSFEAKKSTNRLSCSLNLELVRNGMIKISIVDNGKGIPPHLQQKVVNGFSLKESGHGLGLSRAKDFFTKNFAEFELISAVDKGTTVNIYFPVIAPPHWFSLDIEVANRILVVIDNEPTILAYWQQKLSNSDIMLETFLTAESFFAWLDNKDAKNYTYVIDYSLNGKITGLDIMHKINHPKLCYLVTNNYSNLSIQQHIGTSYLIPKSCLGQISIIKT